MPIEVMSKWDYVGMIVLIVLSMFFVGWIQKNSPNSPYNMRKKLDVIESKLDKALEDKTGK